MTFSLTAKTAFPRPQSDGFPQGIQWRADGTDLGDRHVQTVDLVDFGTGGVTRDEDTLTIRGGASTSGDGGSGESPGVSQGAFNIADDFGPINLASAGFTSTDPADFWVWAKALAEDFWTPVLPTANLGNAPGLPTFAISGSNMSFSDLVAFSEGGSIVIRQLGPSSGGG